MTIPAAIQIPAAGWRKSSYSGGGNNCVEVAKVTGACAVRDSKNPAGGHLVFAAEDWAEFIDSIKQGRYQL